MGDDGDYQVDLEELGSVIDGLSACERALERISSDIEARMRTLHETWEGLSAQAQREAQEAWNEGLTEMREALADMRKAGGTARENYQRAIDANTSTWRRLT